ncbi:MAG: hypothetical protein AW09_002465 [Candidatus Accumulibacter phosphatis]|uniref:Uncharacterized protein n=1 Tax=Candidatus Accumulibacter phosphatis TaxID=327160 RepID=A0A080LUV4_9PROT|nr:MAG: hypothetical protein AW09_002465 [Candidatus Accumulibacter phosphatis]
MALLNGKRTFIQASTGQPVRLDDDTLVFKISEKGNELIPSISTLYPCHALGKRIHILLAIQPRKRLDQEGLYFGSNSLAGTEEDEMNFVITSDIDIDTIPQERSDNRHAELVLNLTATHREKRLPVICRTYKRRVSTASPGATG